MVYYSIDDYFTTDEKFILRHAIEATNIAPLNALDKLGYDITINFHPRAYPSFEQLKIQEQPKLEVTLDKVNPMIEFHPSHFIFKDRKDNENES